MEYDINHMKWWGWGNPKKEFNDLDKPGLWKYIEKKLNHKKTEKRTPINFEAINLPPSKIPDIFIHRLEKNFDSEQIKLDKTERLVHTYGKSFRDLWRIRQGLIDQAPDLVVYPKNEEQVQSIIKLAIEFNFCLIPFGGGTNIVGSIEVKDKLDRPSISVDMKLMNKLLTLNQKSKMATIQAGCTGPYLEYQLNQKGFTLGHFPDSFEYSTLGGWVATRSAGMQSDHFGKIEDMVLALKMITPQGVIETRTVPKSSNGIDINHLCIGSEGILGIITEVTLVVHPLPAKKEYFGFLFPSFQQGMNAIYECVESNCLPEVTRLNDADKTALSLACKEKSTGFGKKLVSKAIAYYLRNVKQFNLNEVCLMITCISGTNKIFKKHKQAVDKIFKKHGGFYLGASPGKAFAKSKYDFPYLRDYVMDYHIMSDVSETSVTWDQLIPFYLNTKEKITKAILETGVLPWVGCHISHNYNSGASLYFTFACKNQPGQELEQYLHIKKAAEDAFIQNGGTLSHHHAVGYEHLPWMKEEISATGILAIKALKQGLDPLSIMNPGKLIPSTEPFNEWGHTECFETKSALSLALPQD